ncbi:proteasome subunit alpha type-3 [Anaeramoeba flamelloides]|uniref:Proteasome subunit alpha type n=1 Tax=Anaeramoeba flamelloides TaxID=1746091 RepID=A0ABQ8XPC2_9EUKA|nr:proteasome subunit alpha type-3 [Anaeramoeba flamelloides]
MSGIGTGYDLYPTTFSPDGRIFQVEYAHKAVENSSTAIGLCCKDGVVFGVEKIILSKMLVEGTNRRVFSVGEHIGIATAGLTADGKRIVQNARQEAKNYENFTSDIIPIHVLTERLSIYVQVFTLYNYIRPFGCSLMIGSYDEEKGPSLYCIEPDSVALGFYGCAIGKGKQEAKTEISKLKLSEMTCKDAVKEIAKILIKTVHDETKEKEMELEMSWVCKETKGKHKLVPKKLIEEAVEWVKGQENEED